MVTVIGLFWQCRWLVGERQDRGMTGCRCIAAAGILMTGELFQKLLA